MTKLENGLLVDLINAIVSLKPVFRGPNCRSQCVQDSPISDDIVESEGYINKESQIAMYIDAGIKYDNWLADNYTDGYLNEPSDDESEVFPEMDGRRTTELDVLEAVSHYHRVKKEADEKQKRWLEQKKLRDQQIEENFKPQQKEVDQKEAQKTPLP